MKHGLPPVVDESSRIVILGTLPGDDSLRLQQYYADPRNQFWSLLTGVFGIPVGTTYAAAPGAHPDDASIIERDTGQACNPFDEKVVRWRVLLEPQE